MDGILRDTACLIQFLGDRITLHGIVLDAFQVEDQRIQHGIEFRGGQVQLLVVIDVGLSCERYIAEGADQIEVAEAAEAHHFSDIGLQFTLRIGGVDSGHAGGILDKCVTTVDDRVETLPIGVTVLGIDVLLEDLLEVAILLNITARTDVVAAELTPDHHTFDNVSFLNACVAAGKNGIHIGLLIPEIL